MEQYITKGDKKLKYGFTTGTCAAAATKAAITMFFMGKTINEISIQVPKGWELTLPVDNALIQQDTVSCAIIKDSGDDPDITNGILIYAKVRCVPSRTFVILGGKGIGRVTRKGLSVEVGQPAINPVPREMIISEAKKLADAYKYEGGFEIEISAPEGEEIVKKTFNPKLGILGGISIIGTTGIVEPMSEKALIDSLILELKVYHANGKKNILLTPGNYGQKFADKVMGLDIKQCIKISNYVGEMMETINNLGFENILFIAHAGKLIKVAGGIMNTHSKNADARMEILSAHASYCGGNSELTQKIMNCITTEEAIDILQETTIFDKIMHSLIEKIQEHLNDKIISSSNLGIVMFTNTHGILGINETGKEMIKLFI